MKRFIATGLCVWMASFGLIAQVTMEKKESGLLFTEQDEKILFYQKVPKNYDGKYERCNYIHPLWGMDGTVLTEDFPADHLHHRGVFWAWHQVWIGEQRIGDPWAINDFEQYVSEVEFWAKDNGTGVLKTTVEWKSGQWEKAGRKVPYIEENTTITVHPKEKKSRRIDFEISLLALEENLSIGGSEDEKGYSGFSVRCILPEDVTFSGPSGMVEPEVTAVQSPGYINISGRMGSEGKNAGIVIADHPGNPDYPQPWILRDKNSMQNAAFPGREAVPVSTTEPLVLKYSLLIYSGKMKHRRITKLLDDVVR